MSSEMTSLCTGQIQPIMLVVRPPPQTLSGSDWLFPDSEGNTNATGQLDTLTFILAGLKKMLLGSEEHLN